MLVVLNHLQFRHLDGGFIGVDVFFVISGYLIGASLIAEFRRNSFSLVSFYERRVRRIFPALLVMLAVITAFTYRYFLPGPLVSYAQSAVGALFSFSNFIFWQQNGYFDAPSAAKPLLHTWSLAVEEQFYLFFPLFLFIIFRWAPRTLRAALWLGIIVTLTLSIWVVHLDPNTAFFCSPLRAWELLLGVLISQYELSPLRNRSFREGVAAVGIMLILVPGVLYNSTTPFPGLAALLPCAGAAMIISAGQVGDSTITKFLSLPPCRFVGLISYSLYLWHWPVFVLQNTNLLFSHHPIWQRGTKLLILAISFVLATFSWWLIEMPFRKGALKLDRRPLFLVNGIAITLIACAACSIVLAKGIPSRLSPQTLRVGDFIDDNTDVAWRTGQCFLLPTNTFADFRPDLCLNTIPDRKNYLLLGDSTAAHLYPRLVRIFPEINIQQATAASCLPYDDVPTFNKAEYRNCDAIWHFLHEKWYPTHRPDAVIVAASWTERSPDALTAELQGGFKAQVQPVMFRLYLTSV